jgi:hypothetical protein
VPINTSLAVDGRFPGNDQTEVEQLGHDLAARLPREEDVRRLDVAMDHAGRMKSVERSAIGRSSASARSGRRPYSRR